MKKFILLSVSMLVLSARAERLEDITIILNVRNNQPVLVAGGGAPVVYHGPVVYNAPVVYNQPVVYGGPVIYNSDVISTCGTGFYSVGDGFYSHRYNDSYFHSSGLYGFGQSYSSPVSYNSGRNHFNSSPARYGHNHVSSGISHSGHRR